MTLKLSNKTLNIRKDALVDDLGVFTDQPGTITFTVTKDGVPTTDLIINSLTAPGSPKITKYINDYGYRRGSGSYSFQDVCKPSPGLLMGRDEDAIDNIKYFTIAFRAQVFTVTVNWTYQPFLCALFWDVTQANFTIDSQDTIIPTVYLKYRSVQGNSCIPIQQAFTGFNVWNNLVFTVIYNKNTMSGTASFYRNGLFVSSTALTNVQEPGYRNLPVEAQQSLLFHGIMGRTLLSDLYIATDNCWTLQDALDFNNQVVLDSAKYKYHWPLLNYTNKLQYNAYEEKGNGPPIQIHALDEFLEHYSPYGSGALPAANQEQFNQLFTVLTPGVYTITAVNRLLQVPDTAPLAEQTETATATIIVNLIPPVVKVGPIQTVVGRLMDSPKAYCHISADREGTVDITCDRTIIDFPLSAVIGPSLETTIEGDILMSGDCDVTAAMI